MDGPRNPSGRKARRGSDGTPGGITSPVPTQIRPAGDEPLESGADTLRAACPTLGRQERHITGRADAPPRHRPAEPRSAGPRSAEGSRLNHHRPRDRCRHHWAAFTTRPAGRAARRLLHRRPAGGLAGLRCCIGLRCGTGLRRRTRCGPSRAGRTELHERRPTAAVGTAETTTAAGGGSEAAKGNHETQGTAHVWHLHHRRVRDGPRSDTMRRPRRRLQTLAHDPAPCRTSNKISQKIFEFIVPSAPILSMVANPNECSGCDDRHRANSRAHRQKTRGTLENSR